MHSVSSFTPPKAAQRIFIRDYTTLDLHIDPVLMIFGQEDLVVRPPRRT